MLLHSHGKIRSTLDRRIVRDDDRLLNGDEADTGHEAGAWRLVLVHAERSQGGQLQKR